MIELLNILVIEDSHADFLMVERHLKQQGLAARCRRVDSLGGLQEAIVRESWDLVLSDYSIPQLNFRESLHLLQTRLPEVPLILVSGSIGEEKAVELLKMGVWDFVLKENLTRLVATIERSLRECTERKARLAAEEALRESESRYRNIFNNSPIAIGIGRRDDGRLVEVNDAWLQLYGFERAEVVGRTTTELKLYVKTDERDELIGIINERGQIVNREVQLRRKTGERITAQYSAEIIRLGDESFLQVMLTDTSEQKRMETELRQSEAMYRSLFGNMLNGFAYCRMIFEKGTPQDFVYLSVNEAFEKQTGLKNVVGRPVTEVIPGIRETDPGLFEIYGRVALSGKPEQFETYVEALKQWYWISVYSPAKEHFVAVFDVITERKRIEAAQEATVELLRLCNLADNLPGLMQELMHYFRKITGCEAIGVRLHDGADFPYYVTLGFSEEFVLAEKCLCSFDQQGELVRDYTGHPAMDCMCGNILCNRTDPTQPFFTPHGSFWSSCTTELLANTSEAERRAKTRNRCNSEGYESVALIPLRYREETYGLFQFNDKEKGRFTADKIALYESLVDYVAIALAKLKSDAALRESNELFRMIFEHSIDAIMLTRTDGSVLAANPEACRVFGMSETEICRAGRAGLVDAADPRVLPLLEERTRTGRCRGEITMIRGDGSRFPAEISCAVFTDQDGIPKTSLVIRDVTERKNLENQLLQSQKMEALGTLAGGIAHDFNNMLNVILGYAELSLMRLSPEDPSHRNMLEIRKAGERSVALTRQLLAFARKQDLVPKIININGVITEQLKMLQRLIGEDVSIGFHPGAELWNTKIDPSQIDQILANLTVNARDAIAGTGTVSIETANVRLGAADIHPYAGGVPGEYVLLLFSDTGAGMDKRTQERIFEPFFTTKEIGKGTGLGLSTVYGVVKQNNGMINVYSEPGIGTTFKVYLPRVEGEAAPEHNGTQGVSLAGTETILLVEDDEQILELVRTMLEGTGYQVLTASSPQEACTVCEQHPGAIDLLVTDVIMPLMNGKELQARIVAMQPGIRTLFMSGYTADIIATRGFIAEGLNFIGKPFTLQTLTQKVREALEG
jgi:two-component system, cell cycle sensor histidine kinase and response regulator CckA